MKKIRNKLRFALFIAMSIASISYAKAQNSTSESNIVQSFLQKLSQDTWITENKDFNGKTGISHFLMKFEVDEYGENNGQIFGVTAKKDTLVFWRITEFQGLSNNETVFVQRGDYGYGVGKGTYVNEHKRIGLFDLNYNNGTTEKHRDIHIFIDENTLETQSEIYDAEKNTWVKQSTMIWRKV